MVPALSMSSHLHHPAPPSTQEVSKAAHNPLGQLSLTLKAATPKETPVEFICQLDSLFWFCPHLQLKIILCATVKERFYLAPYSISMSTAKIWKTKESFLSHIFLSHRFLYIILSLKPGIPIKISVNLESHGSLRM